MKKLVNGLKFFWLPLFVGVFYVYAQNEPSNRFGPRLAAQFADGVKVYNEARYDQAKDVFNRIVSLGPQNKLFTAALLMQARSDLNLGNNSAAHKNLQRLIDLPQPSRYKEHAHFLLGQIAFAEEDFSEAAGGYPWIFKEMKHFMEKGERLGPPDIEERIRVVRQHLKHSLEWKGPKLGVLEMRRHYTNYFKSFPGIKKYRMLLVTEDEPATLYEVLDQIEERYSALV